MKQICLCPSKSTNQHAAFLQPAINVFVAVKLIMQSEKWETSTKTCNETMLHNKLKVFVSRISPPLGEWGIHDPAEVSERDMQGIF